MLLWKLFHKVIISAAITPLIAIGVYLLAPRIGWWSITLVPIGVAVKFFLDPAFTSKAVSTRVKSKAVTKRANERTQWQDETDKNITTSMDFKHTINVDNVFHDDDWSGI